MLSEFNLAAFQFNLIIRSPRLKLKTEIRSRIDFLDAQQLE